MRKILFFLLGMTSGLYLSAQTKTVTGKVTDEIGEPIPFASVMIKGSQKGVPTTDSGTFVIKVHPGDVLQVKSQGYRSVELPVKADERVVFKLHTTIFPGQSLQYSEITSTDAGDKSSIAGPATNQEKKDVIASQSAPVETAVARISADKKKKED